MGLQRNEERSNAQNDIYFEEENKDNQYSLIDFNNQ